MADSIIQRLESVGHQCLSAIEHGAAWLVGTLATSEESLKGLTASSPLVALAVDAGIASAEAHGVPIGPIETAGSELLAAAHALAAGLSQPAPAAKST